MKIIFKTKSDRHKPIKQLNYIQYMGQALKEYGDKPPLTSAWEQSVKMSCIKSVRVMITTNIKMNTHNEREIITRIHWTLVKSLLHLIDILYSPKYVSI